MVIRQDKTSVWAIIFFFQEVPHVFGMSIEFVACNKMPPFE